jgi:adenine phosphoribosyltransferase
MLELFKNTLDNAPTVKRGDYNYFQNPLTDGAPNISPDLLRDICSTVIKISNMDVDVILTMEAMGIHIAAVLSQMTDIPMNIIRKTERFLPDELTIDQTTGYSKGEMYLNGIKSGDKVLIFDIVISTGGTLIAVINGLNKLGAKIEDVVCVIERDDGVAKVKEATGFDVKTLVKIEVGERIKIVDDCFSR